MFWSRGEEETFKPEKEEVEEITEEAKPEERTEEDKIESIMERLETITQQVNLLAKYFSNISQRVSKAIDASVAYQRDLDDLERRIELVRSRIEELEHFAPEVELKREIGKKAA